MLEAILLALFGGIVLLGLVAWSLGGQAKGKRSAPESLEGATRLALHLASGGDLSPARVGSLSDEEIVWATTKVLESWPVDDADRDDLDNHVASALWNAAKAARVELGRSTPPLDSQKFIAMSIAVTAVKASLGAKVAHTEHGLATLSDEAIAVSISRFVAKDVAAGTPKDSAEFMAGMMLLGMKALRNLARAKMGLTP